MVGLSAPSLGQPWVQAAGWGWVTVIGLPAGWGCGFLLVPGGEGAGELAGLPGAAGPHLEQGWWQPSTRDPRPLPWGLGWVGMGWLQPRWC